MNRRHKQPLRNVAHFPRIPYCRPSVALTDVFSHLLEVAIVHFPDTPIVTSMVGGPRYGKVLFALNTSVRNKLVYGTAEVLGSYTKARTTHPLHTRLRRHPHLRPRPPRPQHRGNGSLPDVYVGATLELMVLQVITTRRIPWPVFVRASHPRRLPPHRPPHRPPLPLLPRPLRHR